MASVRLLGGVALLAALWFASPAQAARQASCDRPFATGQETSLSVSSGGVSRTALVYVPSSYGGHPRRPGGVLPLGGPRGAPRAEGGGEGGAGGPEGGGLA